MNVNFATELATSKCKVMRIGKCINKSNYYLNDNL